MRQKKLKLTVIIMAPSKITSFKISPAKYIKTDEKIHNVVMDYFVADITFTIANGHTNEEIIKLLKQTVRNSPQLSYPLTSASYHIIFPENHAYHTDKPEIDNEIVLQLMFDNNIGESFVPECKAAYSYLNCIITYLYNNGHIPSDYKTEIEQSKNNALIAAKLQDKEEQKISFKIPQPNRAPSMISRQQSDIMSNHPVEQKPPFFLSLITSCKKCCGCLTITQQKRRIENIDAASSAATALPARHFPAGNGLSLV